MPIAKFVESNRRRSSQIDEREVGVSPEIDSAFGRQPEAIGRRGGRPIGDPLRRETEPAAPLGQQQAERHQREQLLSRVTAHGFIADYSGVRIAKSGHRFRIQRATVWNVTDAAGHRIGQAATFCDWTPCD